MINPIDKLKQLLIPTKEVIWALLFRHDDAFITSHYYAIGEQREEIERLEEQISDLTFKLSGLHSQLEDEKTEFEKKLFTLRKLVRILKDNDSNIEKPTFLDDRTPFTPRIRIAAKNGDKVITINPTDVYSSNAKVKSIVEVNKWKELYSSDKKACAYSIWEYVILSLTYEYDKEEDWRTSVITINYTKGDCVSTYEEIYTDDGIKKVGDLKLGDLVLSYNLNSKKYVYKPIIKIWEKGELPRKRVHFRNGNHIDITNNHPLWTRSLQKKSVYEKTYLKDVDLSRWWKRKVPTVKQLPYKINDIGWLNENLCFVLGHYLAEGYDGYTCGYDCIEHIIPILEKEHIPFTETKNNSGVPVIRFKKSNFKDYLKSLKNNSFDINLPEELFHLSKKKLEKIVKGHLLGDGHYCRPFTGKNHIPSNALYCHSTSSEQLANDLIRIYLQIGKPLYKWKQLNHQGVGTKPIWRLTLNPESYFNKDYGYEGLSEVSISYIEDLTPTKMRDFTVENTHTFIFKNGIVSHQCEDGTILFIDLCHEAGFKADEIFNATGWFTKPDKSRFGHSYPILNYGNGWFIYETTINRVPNKPKLFMGSNYGAEWGLANWYHYGRLKNGAKQI